MTVTLIENHWIILIYSSIKKSCFSFIFWKLQVTIFYWIYSLFTKWERWLIISALKKFSFLRSTLLLNFFNLMFLNKEKIIIKIRFCWYLKMYYLMIFIRCYYLVSKYAHFFIYKKYEIFSKIMLLKLYCFNACLDGVQAWLGIKVKNTQYAQ